MPKAKSTAKKPAAKRPAVKRKKIIKPNLKAIRDNYKSEIYILVNYVYKSEGQNEIILRSPAIVNYKDIIDLMFIQLEKDIQDALEEILNCIDPYDFEDPDVVESIASQIALSKNKFKFNDRLDPKIKYTPQMWSKINFRQIILDHMSNKFPVFNNTTDSEFINDFKVNSNSCGNHIRIHFSNFDPDYDVSEAHINLSIFKIPLATVFKDSVFRVQTIPVPDFSKTPLFKNINNVGTYENLDDA